MCVCVGGGATLGKDKYYKIKTKKSFIIIYKFYIYVSPLNQWTILKKKITPLGTRLKKTIASKDSCMLFFFLLSLTAIFCFSF